MPWVPARDTTYRKFAKRIYWLKEVIVEPTDGGSGSGSGMPGGEYGVGLSNLSDLLNIQVNITGGNNVFAGFQSGFYNGVYVFKTNGRLGTGWYRSINMDDDYFAITYNNNRFIHYFGSNEIFTTKQSSYNEIFDLYDLQTNDWTYVLDPNLFVTHTISVFL
jgi:hypothetical protein